jgi:hypothetical protein
VDDAAAMLPRSGADVDDMVGDLDGLLVVLDHDDGITEVAQSFERADETLVVPLVEPNGRFVEHVQNADQARADLAGQTDALGLAAGKGGGRAGQSQVVESHIEQKLHPFLDLAEHPVGDHVVPVRQFELSDFLDGPTDGKRAESMDGESTDGHGQRLGL